MRRYVSRISVCLFLVLVIMAARPAASLTGTAPYSSCAGHSNGDSINYALICDGSTWNPVGSFGASSSSGTAGYVQFSGGAGALSSDSTTGGQFFWDSTNHRLGIGTAGPTDPLQVQKDQNAFTNIIVKNGTAGTSAAANFLAYNDVAKQIKTGILSSTATPAGQFAAGDSYVYTDTNLAIGSNGGIIKFATNGVNEKARIDANGNLGIGTTNPAYKLDVAGPVNTSAVFATTASIGTTVNTYPMVIYGSAAGTGNILAKNTNATGISGLEIMNNGGSLQARVGYDNSAAAMIINSISGNPINLQSGGATYMTMTGSGNVGIGTTLPSAQLDTSGGEIRIQGGASFGNLASTGKGLELAYNTSTDYGAVIAYNRSTSAYKTLQLDGAPTIINYNSGGNVGIGTTSPAGQLDVSSAFYTTTGKIILRTQDGVNEGSEIGMTGAGSNVGYTIDNFASVARIFWVDSGTRQFQIFNAGAGSAGLYVQGNVGIGTTNPSYLLHVNGTAYASGAAGALSDIRHKKNVATLKDGALAIVEKLRPVTYEWKEPKDDGMRGTQTGFIAQEVEKLLPATVITEPNKEKTKGLKYNEFAPILTKGIQELKALVDTVAADGKKLAARTDETFAREEKELAELRENDKELRQENAALRSAVCALSSKPSFCSPGAAH